MPRSAKTFVTTDFSVFERENAAHFEALRERDPASAFEIGEALRAHAIATQPGWPSAEERQRDHEDHLRLIAMLDRVPRRR